MDAARPESALRDLEALAETLDDVGLRHTHIVEMHFAVAIGLVVLAEHRQHAFDRHAGRVERHDHHAVLLVAMRAGIGQSHEDHERSEEHTSELQSLMRNSYAVFCLQKKTNKTLNNENSTNNNI